MKRTIPAVVCLGLALTVAGSTLSGVNALAQGGRRDNSVDTAAAQRAEKTVRMLDDIYKVAIVLITDKYVKEESSYPAGRIAVHWFETISKKGWHEVRLIDATGKPYDGANVAKSAFEKRALQELKSGKDFVKEVVEKDGKHYLLAATPVPVVMAKCTLCHPHYKDAKPGAAIGAITYKVPIE